MSRPVLAHCAVKALCERGPITPNMTPMSGRTMSATRVSLQEIDSIMATTPTTVSTEVTALDRDCWRVLVTLSTSLVRRLRSSPRWTRSK